MVRFGFCVCVFFLLVGGEEGVGSHPLLPWYRLLDSASFTRCRSDVA